MRLDEQPELVVAPDERRAQPGDSPMLRRKRGCKLGGRPDLEPADPLRLDLAHCAISHASFGEFMRERADQDLVRRGRRLGPGAGVHGVTGHERLSGVAGDDLTAVDADAQLELEAAARVQRADPLA
jgi:hypothetical protein